MGWKDRKDGRYLRVGEDIEPINSIMSYLMPRRTDCEVFTLESIDVINLLCYLKERGSIEGNNVTLFSTIVSSFVRLGKLRPRLNRFIRGYRIYERKDIDVGFVAKSKLDDNGKEFVIRLQFDKDSNIFDVTDRIYAEVNKVRTSELSGSNKDIDRVARLPRFINRMFFKILLFLDFHGWAPKGLTADDPNFASVFISNLGSIHHGAPFHHLNEWGTNSMFVCIGEIYDKPVVRNGEVVVRPHIDFGITMDERIADGAYFVRSMDLLKELLGDPRKLEETD